MTKLRYLSVLLSQRLTLAAQEIFKDVEETILELQEETKLAKQENAKLKLKLREAGINSCDESRKAVTPAEVQSCGGQRPEVLLEDSSTIASLKQELDALDEVETQSVDSGPAAMQIKMEMNYTECSSLERQSGCGPQPNSSGMQTDSVTVSIGELVASLPVLEPREPVMFPCVERTWSVGAKEAETSQITEIPCNRTGNCPPEDDDVNEDYVYDDQDNVDKEVTHEGDAYVLDPVKESENIDEKIHHKPQMPQEKPFTRAELARCSNSCLENSNEESTVGKETSVNNIRTVVKTGKPRGRPRKHPQTSTPKPALIDLKHDTRNSRLRSGNKRNSAITGRMLRRLTKHPQLSTKKSVKVDSGNGRDLSRIGRPMGRPKSNLQIAKAKSDAVNLQHKENSNSTIRSSRLRGKHRKHYQTLLSKPDEVNSEQPSPSDDKTNSAVRAGSPKRRSRSHLRNSRAKSDEVNSEHEESCSIEEPTPVRTGRPRGRPRKHPGPSTANSDEVNLEDEENISGEASNRPSKHTGTSTAKSEKLQSERKEENASGEGSSSAVRTGRSRGRPRKHLQASTSKPDEVNLEDEEKILVEESNSMISTGRKSGRPRKHPQSTTIKPAEVDLEDEENTLVAESNPTISTGRQSSRPRKHLQASTSKPDEVNLEDEENTLVEESNPMISTGRKSGRPRKHPQSTTIKPAEVDLEDEENTLVAESNPMISTGRQSSRPRKHLQASTSKPEEVNLEDEENTLVEESNPMISTGRQSSRPRKHLQASTSKPDEVTLEDEENTLVAESNPMISTGRQSSRPRKHLQASTSKPEEVNLEDEENTLVEESNPMISTGRQSGRPRKHLQASTSKPDEVTLEDEENTLVAESNPMISTGRQGSSPRKHLQASTSKPDEVNLEDEENTLVEESTPIISTGRKSGRPRKHPQSTTIKPAEVDLDHKDSVSEDPSISEDNTDLSRSNRTSGRLRTRTETSTIQPVEMDHQDSASSDDEGDDGDSSMFEKPRRTPMKRPRSSSSSDFEIDMEEEDEPSDEDSSCGSHRDSTRNERSRKNLRTSRAKAVEPDLDHVSVLCHDMGLVKKGYCLYCAKPIIKLARHLAMRHFDQKDVVEALSHPKNSKERKIKMGRLRNCGNRAHNNRVLKEGRGILIPSRAYKAEDPKDVVYCHGCHGMFSKDSLSKHTRLCAFVREEDNAGPCPEEDLSLHMVVKQAPKDFSEVLSGMYQDDVTEAVRQDKLILKLGQLMFDKRLTCEYIWQRLRELGRLLLNGRKITPLYEIEDYIRLSNWDHLAAAVKDAVGFCETTCTFAIPKYAVALRRSLTKIAGIVKCDAEASGDKEMLENAQNFQESLLIKWHQQFVAPGMPTSNSLLLVVTEQTSNGREDQRSGSEDNISAAQSRTEHGMERLEHSGIQFIPANQEDEAHIKNTQESSPGEVTKMESSGNGNSACPPEDDDLEREAGDNEDDNDTDCDDDDDDANDDDDDDDDYNASGHDVDTDGADDFVPVLRSANKTLNSKNESLNGPSNSAQNDTPPKPLNRLQPQRITAAAGTTSSVSDSQENVSDQKTAPEKSVTLPPRSVNDHRISVISKHFKRQFCLFCKKPVTKIAKHLQRRHYEQEDVAKALSYPKLSKERKMYLHLLRRKGNRVHNTQVLKEGKGEIVPCKWGLGKASDFLHCPYCDGMFLKRRMARHLKTCPFAKRGELTMPKKRVRGSVQALCLMGETVPENVSKEFWKVLSSMHQDEIALAVRGDKYALQLGQQLINKGQGEDAIREDTVRQRLRELGRLLVSCQKITPMHKLEDFILPSNWDHLVAVVKDVAGHKDETDYTLNVSLLSHLYRSFQKIGRIIELDAETQQDEHMVELARNFNRDFVEKWRKHFPASVEPRKSQECHSGGIKLLYFTEDIRHLHTYLKDKLAKCMSALCTSANQATWHDLARVVLAQLIMFNRKKANVVAQLTLKDFKTKEAYGMPDDNAELLTPFERELCKFTCRIQISRATGDNVQILAPPALINIMEIMFHRRILCGIRYDNIFLFAMPKTRSQYSGVKTLQVLAEDCGAEPMKALVSNGLRKHVAMISQLLYLKDMHQLTEFMGFNLTSHLRNDCLQQETLGLARLGKVFTAMEKEQLKAPEQNVHEVLVSPDEIVQPADSSSADEDDDDEKHDDYHPSKSVKSQQAKCKAVKRNPKRKSVAVQKWNQAEIQAVETHMAMFISSGKTPGKTACTACIMAEPDALKARNWTAIKFYVKNRITSLRKKNSKPSQT